MDNGKSYVFFPYLKTSSRFRILEIDFFPSGDLSELNDVDRAHVERISKMFFTRTNLMIQNSTFAILPILDSKLNQPDVQKIRVIRNLFSFIYGAIQFDQGQPHYFESEVTWPYFFFERKFHILETDSGVNVENIGKANNEESTDRFIDGYWVTQNFNSHYSISFESRIYSPTPNILLNIHQNLYEDIFSQKHENEQHVMLISSLIEEGENDANSNYYTALDWYNEAIKDSNSIESKIINLSIAFESLFCLDRDSKTESLIRSVWLLLGREKRLDEWVKQFYSLRSSIVHEGKADSFLFVIAEKRDIKHQFGSIFSTGLGVFQICFYSLLFGRKMLSDSNLSMLFSSNMERYEKILRIASANNFTDRSIGEVSELIYEINANLDIPEPTLKITTQIDALKKAIGVLRNPSTSLSEEFWQNYNNFSALDFRIEKQKSLELVLEMFRHSTPSLSNLTPNDKCISTLIRGVWSKAIFEYRFE